MRIRPPELETSICDVKYHVSLVGKIVMFVRCDSGYDGYHETHLIVTVCVVPEKSNAIIGVVTSGFECLPPSYDGLTGPEDHGPMISPVDTLCGDWYKASLPKISSAEKGKAPLHEKDPIKEELKAQIQAHGLRWEKTCCSKIFEGKSRDHGAVIARSNTNTKSSCWIRTMVRVNDSWVIEPCADYWKPLPRQVVCNEVLPQVSYVDTIPTVSEFFKLLKRRWADVCPEAAEFFVSGTLLPVGSLNFCRALTVVQPTQDFGFRRPTVTTWGWSHLCTAFIRYSLFNGLRSVAFSVSGSATVLVRPTFGVANIFDTSVQIASVPLLSDTAFDSDVQMTDIQHSTSESDSSSSSEQLDFHVNSPDDEKTSTD
ncbi:hypothetical protein F511_41746 [Dorcoceras hygrometricum]|uniref:Uncharacterized protein n=1 Tax=Dorcoceras hygrometricum TaxID=472368 RepID=A0A2Z7BKY9_9LAMI|nr:hypothetical protein F511_41746 [Dorcoceras hygrometricum]